MAFWEASLFYSLVWGGEGAEHDILGNISTIPKVPIHIVHGKGNIFFLFCSFFQRPSLSYQSPKTIIITTLTTGDFLCPIEFAKKLENSFINNGFEIKVDYIDSGHKVSNQPIKDAVRNAVAEFAALMREKKE